MKKVAIIGIVGLPAKYGGFETLVNHIIINKNYEEIQYSVYCSSRSYKYKLAKYNDARLVYLPFKANGIQSLIYDVTSLIHASLYNDIILILGISGCFFLPIYRIFSKKKIIINMDGLEHRRQKWRKWIKCFLLFSERMAIKYSNIIITDNKGIQKYVKDKYKKQTELIAYGGDHAICKVESDIIKCITNKYGIVNEEYSFSVCRIEPENNVHLILESFMKANKKIIFVGNWMKSEYSRKIYRKYENERNIKLLFPIYNLSILFLFRSNCQFYIHGHSAGGTNPSLVEAMFFSKPILAFDVIYNRETTSNKAHYFSSVDTLVALLKKDKKDFFENSINMGIIARELYSWKKITNQYENLFKN